MWRFQNQSKKAIYTETNKKKHRKRERKLLFYKQKMYKIQKIVLKTFKNKFGFLLMGYKEEYCIWFESLFTVSFWHKEAEVVVYPRFPLKVFSFSGLLENRTRINLLFSDIRKNKNVNFTDFCRWLVISNKSGILNI